jgi:hypothetical protein
VQITKNAAVRENALKRRLMAPETVRAKHATGRSKVATAK